MRAMKGMSALGDEAGWLITHRVVGVVVAGAEGTFGGPNKDRI